MHCKHFLTIIIYIAAINLFGVFLKLLQYTHVIFQYNTFDPPNFEYDYIVVGCGSAGATVARRLAEDKNNNILILEAGPFGHRFLDIPALGILLQRSHFSWRYNTVPQNNACLGLKESKSFWPTGKIVGGTGMLNNMIYVRGHPEDFDDWFQNKEGYNFTYDVEPYFKKLENFKMTEYGRTLQFATNPFFMSILQTYLIPAIQSLGFPILNSTLHCDEGFGEPTLNQNNGQRWTPAHYILHGNYPNIYLYTEREVNEILFHNNFEAYGVKYKYLNQVYKVRAKKGIILSAGAIGSPKILLQSGVGPKKDLEELKIPINLNLPVGENLQDHVTTGLDLIVLNQSLGIGLQQMFSPFSAFDYFWNGRGPWTTGGCETVGFLKTKYSSRPDIQFMVMPHGVSDDGGIFLRDLFGIKDEVWNKYFALLKHNMSITILPVLLHPKSKGTIRLNSSNEIDINPNYLSHQDDVDVLMEGINMIKKIINTESMQKIGAKLNTNVFPGCEHFKFDSKPYWECYIRQLTISSYHPVGTCKMGDNNDKFAVVNFQFEVKGTNNLFVVDGSVLPNQSSGNVNGAILMLAEMASDMLKLRNYLNLEKCDIIEIFMAKNVC